jgi:2-iminobutanoate/2-iminopropanoate deaminase
LFFLAVEVSSRRNARDEAVTSAGRYDHGVPGPFATGARLGIKPAQHRFGAARGHHNHPLERDDVMKFRNRLLAAGASAVLGVAVANAAPQYFAHQFPANTKPLPFSDAVRVADTLYVGGHIGIDPSTGQAPSDPAVEARLLMDSVQATLKSAGLTMDDFVSVTVYCTDLALYDSFNGVYAGYFHGKFPARALIGVASVLRGGHFEIQGIAVKPVVAHH